MTDKKSEVEAQGMEVASEPQKQITQDITAASAPELKVKIPGPPPLVDLLDLGIEEEIRKEEQQRLKGKIERFPLSPSQFGACARQLAMNLAEATGKGLFPLELLDSRAKRRFTRGYDIEYSLLKQFRKYVPIAQGFGQQYLAMDLTQDGKYVIGGSLDSLFMTEEHMIVDIKSKATYWSDAFSDKFEQEFQEIADMPGVTRFGDRALYIENIEEFYERYSKDNFISRYLLQLNAYGACDWSVSFRSNLFPGVCGVSAVALIFENKNNHMMMEVRWKPSRKLYDFAIKRMKDIYQWVVIDGKPADKYPADFTLGTTACYLCPRKAACWGDTRMPYNGPKRKWAKDSHKTPNKDALEKIYDLYKKSLNAKADYDTLELELIKEFVASGETKLRFPDGKVYEIKQRKTPKPHFKLYPSK